MRRRIWSVALLCLGLASPAGAQTPTAAKTDNPDMARLIEQLGDVDYRKRDEAVLRLRAEGVKALPALREALNHPDPEIRHRACDLVPILETAAILTPKRVTLKLNNRPVRAALDAVEKQTGYKIESWGSSNRDAFSFDFADLPFWEALDRVCAAAGLVLQQGYGDDRVRLHAQEGHVPYVRYEGPFRLVPTGFQHYRNIEFGVIGRGGAGTNRNESLTLGFTIFAEPKIPLLGMGEVRLDAAYDTDNNSMLVPGGGVEEGFNPKWGVRGGRWISRYGMGNRMLSLQTQVMLTRPSDKAVGVKVVRGHVPVTLLAQQTPMVVVPEILKAKGVRNKIDTTSFHIEDVNQLANKQVQVKLTIAESTENPHDYTWMNSLFQRIELQDSAGSKFAVMGTNWLNSSPGSVQVTLTFSPQGNKIGAPTKLIYYRWITLQHEIAFEFKDLPLP